MSAPSVSTGWAISHQYVIHRARIGKTQALVSSILGTVYGFWLVYAAGLEYMLGGAFFPIGGSGLLATLSDLTPPAAFIRGLGITHAGGGVADLGGPLTSIAAFALISVIGAMIVPDRDQIS